MAERLADDTAVAMLANALATGAILVVLTTALGSVSGAHFNPAITFAFTMRGEVGLGIAIMYLAAQIAGGVSGTLLAHGMFEEDLLQFSLREHDGSAQWLSEFVATFGLIATILAGRRFRPSAVPWLVGLYISVAYCSTASTGFANPAVTIARSLTDTFSGIQPSDVPLFATAQFVGAALAVFAMGWMLRSKDERD